MPESIEKIPPALSQGHRKLPADPGCEWNPDRGAPALPGSDHHLVALAVWVVVTPRDGDWRLCNPCSQRMPFKGMPRVRLPRAGR